jgi:RNA polymerase sigma factor (sigma-70 family)
MRMFENHTDSELLQLSREGNQGAFREIYIRYADKLFHYAKQRVNNHEDCKELVQEVFEAIWKSEKEIHQLSHLLYTILKFRIINFYEHKAVRRKFSDYITLFKSDMAIVEDSEPEIDQLRAVIDRSMESLPERCKETVRLRIDEELSLDDIATRMNLDKGSVKRYLTMAMNYFRSVHSPLYRSK